MQVKICGITDIETALVAAEAGANAIGLVFAPSRRQVSAEQARAITHAAPPFVTKVGVFVDETPSRVNELAAACGLDCVQLHGEESPDACAAATRPVIKAIRMSYASSRAQLSEYRVAAFLLDADVPGKAGGTGRTFDWELAVPMARTARVILSGGLTPENVQDALNRVRPFGVDVSSGVETRGRKDPQKIRAFIARVRDWECAQRGAS